MDDITGEKCRQFRLQFPPEFIGRAVFPVGEKRMGQKEGDNGYRYFSPLQSSLYDRI